MGRRRARWTEWQNDAGSWFAIDRTGIHDVAANTLPELRKAERDCAREFPCRDVLSRRCFPVGLLPVAQYGATPEDLVAAFHRATELQVGAA